MRMDVKEYVITVNKKSMKNFIVRIEMNSGRVHYYKVVAVTDEHAIDLAYYRDGFHRIQSDANKYQCSISTSC